MVEEPSYDEEVEEPVITAESKKGKKKPNPVLETVPKKEHESDQESPEPDQGIESADQDASAPNETDVALTMQTILAQLQKVTEKLAKVTETNERLEKENAEIKEQLMGVTQGADLVALASPATGYVTPDQSSRSKPQTQMMSVTKFRLDTNKGLVANQQMEPAPAFSSQSQKRKEQPYPAFTENIAMWVRSMEDVFMYNNVQDEAERAFFMYQQLQKGAKTLYESLAPRLSYQQIIEVLLNEFESKEKMRKKQADFFAIQKGAKETVREFYRRFLSEMNSSGFQDQNPILKRELFMKALPKSMYNALVVHVDDTLERLIDRAEALESIVTPATPVLAVHQNEPKDLVKDLQQSIIKLQEEVRYIKSRPKRNQRDTDGKALCSSCGRGRHTEDECWDKHPELRPPPRNKKQRTASVSTSKN